MPEFITRIELNENKDSSLYPKLHTAMEAKGFQRWVFINESKWALPHGEYYRECNLTAEGVLNEAYTAAVTVWQDVDIVVTKAEVGGLWVKLKTQYVEPAKPTIAASSLFALKINPPR